MIQPFLFDKVNLHDSCGVNNLHGVPGVLGGLFSVAMTAIATEEVYGPALYLVMPNMAPSAENETRLAELQAKLPSIEAGEGRTAWTQVTSDWPGIIDEALIMHQALMQLASLGVTMAMAVVGGLITGYIIHIDWIFSILKDHELFDDSEFFDIPEDDGEPVRSAPLAVSTVEQSFGNHTIMPG